MGRFASNKKRFVCIHVFYHMHIISVKNIVFLAYLSNVVISQVFSGYFSFLNLLFIYFSCFFFGNMQKDKTFRTSGSRLSHIEKKPGLSRGNDNSSLSFGKSGPWLHYLTWKISCLKLFLLIWFAAFYISFNTIFQTDQGIHVALSH